MKIRVLLAVLLAMGLAVTGCRTTTCDGRGPSEICEIHHAIMQTELLSKNRKSTAPSQEYLVARMTGFLHSYPYVLPEQCDKTAVYICDDCVRAEHEWIRRHPGEK